MAVGDTVIKYGVDIGKVVALIGAGSTPTSTTSRPSVGNSLLTEPPAMQTKLRAIAGKRPCRRAQPGDRSPVDDLSNAACEAVAHNIKGALAIPHPYGRLQFGADLDLHFRTLIGTGANPNVAAVVVIGIEEQWTRRVVEGIKATGKPVA
jgi:hypothetical protein